MKILLFLVVLLLLIILLMVLFPQINFRAMPMGLCEGQLPKNKPNWVSSLVAKTDSHYIHSLKFQDLDALIVCIKKQIPELKLVQTDTRRVLGYRQSKIFHFTDWLCIQADGHVESSATMGHSDFGKNRALVERIRQLCP